MFEVGKVSETLIRMAEIFNCSYKTAWEQWTHPAITDRFTFEEVNEYIKNNI